MNPNVLQILEVLTVSSPIILCVGIVLAALYFSRLEGVHKILLLYMVAALIIDILGRILGHYVNNNLILIPIFGLIEILLLTRLYFTYFIGVKNKFWLIPIGVLICFNFYEIFSLYGVEPKDFNCTSRVLDSLTIVLFSIIFFIKIIADSEIAKKGFLFLNSVIFAYHSLNLIIYLPINFLINETSNIKFHFWSISLLLTLIFYLSIIRIIWIHGKNHKP